MTKDLKFLIKIVKQASKIITTNVQVMPKGDRGDLVTNCDIKIEKFLIDKIKKSYPNFDLISEEFGNSDKLTENCFTIDPIDGTINFANGLPLWGIQVACVRNGKTCAAVIYMPAMKELFYADETGAYKNGKRICVNNLAPQKVLYNAYNKYRSEKENLMYRKTYYCSAHFFSWVACGRLGAAIFSLNDHSWDIVPGIYIAEKAGATYVENKKFKIIANSADTVKYFEEIFK